MDAKSWLPIVSAATALVGVGVGAGFQYLSTRALNAESRVTQIRTQAYTDFLDAQAHFKVAREQNDSAEVVAANREIRAALMKVAVFSTHRVANSLAGFLAIERGRTPCEESAADFQRDIALYRNMRGENFRWDRGEDVSDSTLSLLAFGCVFRAQAPAGPSAATSGPGRAPR